MTFNTRMDREVHRDAAGGHRVAGPGTNRDTDAVLALDLAGAEPTVVLAAELVARPELLDEAQIVVVAGGFSYGDALGAGRMLALDLTLADGGRLGDGSAASSPAAARSSASATASRC